MSDVFGTSGNDTLMGSDDAEVISGGDGRDRLNGADGNDTMYGGAEQDYVYGDGGDDVLYGEGGNDALVGHSGEDTIYGGDGNDGVFGGGNADEIHGEAGNDHIFGDGGDDVILGGAGDDRLNGGSGNDLFIQTIGDGVDVIAGNTGTDTLELQMTAAQLEASRAELISFSEWLEGVAAPGTNNGEAYSFENFDLTVSSIERINFVVDGETVTLADISNTDPVAPAEQTLSGLEDEAVSGNVQATDADGDALTYALQVNAIHGNVALNAETGDFTYTPNAGFAGDDSFQVLVDDGNGGQIAQTVNVSLAAVADAPELAITIHDETGNTTGSTTLNGTSGSDNIVGSAGADIINGGDGNDVIMGDPVAGTAGGSAVSVAIEIELTGNDPDQSERLTVAIEGVPTDASLTSGEVDINGVWHLEAADLDGLRMVSDEAITTDLTITATATETDGPSASVSQTVSVVSAEPAGANDTISGGAGNDTLDGGEGFDIVDFSDAPGSVTVGLAWNQAVGDGVDQITNFEGVVGSSNSDVLYGTNGDNSFEGGAGNDGIYAFAGNDTASGGDGNDLLYGYSGNDDLSGDAGNDQLFGDSGDDQLSGGDGNDNLYGGANNDILTGGAGNDGVYGGAGNDTVFAGDGSNDRYDGGSGTDTIDYSQVGSAVDVDLGSNNGRSDDGGRDQLSGFENLVGSAFSDELEGSDSTSNVISGGAGDDIISGERGADTLSGGSGSDTFSFDKRDVVSGSNHHGVDTITDFGAGDRLDFEGLVKLKKNDSADDVVRIEETDNGTIVQVDLSGSAGWTDVVLLEKVFDLDLDYLLDNGQIVLGG